jgi:hypothetical protein
MKILFSIAVIFLLVVGFGCATSHKYVLVSVVDSGTGRPVAGATVGVHFFSRTQVVTGRDGMALLRLSGKEAEDPIFDVKIDNAEYDQYLGEPDPEGEWVKRSADTIPSKPDVVLEVTSRLDEKRADEEREAKLKAAQQAAEKLIRESPDNWPERTNDVAEALFSIRWDRASKGRLGIEADIDSIRAVVVKHMGNPNGKVREIRWVSPTVVMVKSSWYTGPLAAASYTYVLRKGNSGWTVVTYALDAVS